MFTFIAFILTMLGCINWLMVGLLQYDFIAGLFGFQASIFSRLCYIVIGVGAMYLLLRIIINKGTFKVFERKKKKKEKNLFHVILTSFFYFNNRSDKSSPIRRN